MNSDQLKQQVKAKLRQFYTLSDSDEHKLADICPSFHQIKTNSKRYKIQEEIASGGMKSILKAEDSFTRRSIAMAVLHEESKAEMFDPFIHEAWLTAQLDHPNIISIHDLGINESGTPFFTMDLKVGNSLESYLENHKTETVNLKHALDSFLKICNAISYSHSKGILHLDLKPANIQLGQYGEVVVCDWGLGKISSNHTDAEYKAWDLDQDLKMTKTLHGKIKGTPAYMAPEQIDNRCAKSEQSDIYGLGCILFSLLSRAAPYCGSVDEILLNTLKGPLPYKKLEQGSTPSALCSIIKKATALEAHQRYSSVDDLKHDIQRFLDGYSTSVESTGLVNEFYLFYKRNWIACSLVSGFIFTAIIATLIFIQTLEKSRQEELAARTLAERALQAYESEKNNRYKLHTNKDNDKFHQSRFLSNDKFYLNPQAEVHNEIQRLEEALLLRPKSNLLINQLTHAYLIKLDFARVIKYAKQCKPVDEDLLNTALSLNSMPNQASPPTVLNFLKILGTLKKQLRSPLGKLHKILIYDAAVRRDFTHYELVVKESLALYNPHWDKSHFYYEKSTAHLSLRSDNLKKLRYSWELLAKSPLSYLKVDSLNLSGSAISSLSQLYELNPKELDISGTKINKKLISLNRFSHLKKLIIDKDQFTEKELSSLAPHIEVIKNK